ncbi:MAG: 3-dehydroquinate synthase [Lentisphaerae bacterium]|nr:3-dehydroquinate synthase [Lentisphaerota bacterium]
MSEFSITYRYEAYFTTEVFAPGNELLCRALQAGGLTAPVRVFFVVEKELLQFYPELPAAIEGYCRAHVSAMKLAAPPLLQAGGEACKDIGVSLQLCEAFLAARLCRQSCVIIVGGGALLDAAGFAAAIFHRGLRQLRIPTTALSQCDSGVGVKNGVNYLGKKNLLGCFAPPLAVINDAAFLRTLPPEMVSAAAAEAVKVAMIKDSDFFAWLTAQAPAIMAGDLAALATLVRRSAEIHQQHIVTGGDPFEYGSARPLDFGHWSAHKMEMLSEQRLSHGVAVGMGMLIDCRYAVLMGILAKDAYTALRALLRAFALPFDGAVLELRDAGGRRLVMAGLEEFREHLGGQLHITLPTAIGAKIEVTSIDDARMNEAMDLVLRDE